MQASLTHTAWRLRRTIDHGKTNDSAFSFALAFLPVLYGAHEAEGVAVLPSYFLIGGLMAVSNDCRR